MAGILMWQLWIIPALVFLYLSLNFCEAQIPTACANAQSLPAGSGDHVRECCPDSGDGKCGVDAGRGRCVPVGTTRNSNDLRVNWPSFYFTHVCMCNEMFGGVDCSSCAYGRYPHGTCDQRSPVKQRKSLSLLTQTEWTIYRNALMMIRTTDSGYKAVVNGSRFDPAQGYASIQGEIRDLSFYQYFVWIHYLVAKNSEPARDTGTLEF